jgi:hypothetical protein
MARRRKNGGSKGLIKILVCVVAAVWLWTVVSPHLMATTTTTSTCVIGQKNCKP